MEQTYSKNQQLLAYLAKNNPGSSITVLMKLSYLIDLFNIRKGGSQISSFSYIRYYYGPYDAHINDDIGVLVASSVLIPKVEYVGLGNEYIGYNFNNEADFSFNELNNAEEMSIIDGALNVLKGHGARTLTEIAYKTKPMKALGATLGGNEHLLEPLNLYA